MILPMRMCLTLIMHNASFESIYISPSPDQLAIKHVARGFRTEAFSSCPAILHDFQWQRSFSLLPALFREINCRVENQLASKRMNQEPDATLECVSYRKTFPKTRLAMACWKASSIRIVFGLFTTAISSLRSYRGSLEGAI